MTPEQEKAYADLTAAIEAVTAAHVEPGDPTGLLIDYVVVTALHHDTIDGEIATGHGTYTPSHQPAYRTLGLLDQAATQLRHHFTHH